MKYPKCKHCEHGHFNNIFCTCNYEPVDQNRQLMNMMIELAPAIAVGGAMMSMIKKEKGVKDA